MSESIKLAYIHQCLQGIIENKIVSSVRAPNYPKAAIWFYSADSYIEMVK